MQKIQIKPQFLLISISGKRKKKYISKPQPLKFTDLMIFSPFDAHSFRIFEQFPVRNKTQKIPKR